MAKTIKEERLCWVLPIVRKEIRLKDAAKVCPYGKRSLERWVAAYMKDGASALEPRSTRPKTHPEETAARELAEETGLSARRTRSLQNLA